MTYFELALIHLATVVPAFILGTFLLLARKGSTRHKRLGAVYLVLMFITSWVTMFMSAEVGPRFLHHFGWIHLLSILTIITVPLSWNFARRKNIKGHRFTMMALYFGGLIIAGSFAFTPGRMLHGWIFT